MASRRLPPIDARLHLDDVVGHMLHKQHLVPKARTSDLVNVVEDIVGLHATLPTTPHLSLFARTPDFRREWLEHQLFVARTLIRIKCMRQTVFIVPTSALTTLFAATRRVIEANARRWYLASGGVTPEEYERLAPRIAEVLRGRELTVTEIRASLGGDAAVSSVVGLLCDQGVLVRTRPARGWRDAANAYALMNEWLPDINLESVPEKDAIARMVRAYLSAYGPVTERDIAWWTGLTMISLRAALATLAPEVARVEVSGLAGSFLMLRSQLAACEGTAVADGTVLALLPVLDPYVMGYKERGRYLDIGVANRVFDRGGNGTSTILLDGRIVGVWDAVERPAPSVRLHLFAPGDGDLLMRLSEHARRVGAFLFGADVEVQQFARMNPLTDRPTGAYSPFAGAAGVDTL